MAESLKIVNITGSFQLNKQIDLKAEMLRNNSLRYPLSFRQKDNLKRLRRDFEKHFGWSRDMLEQSEIYKLFEEKAMTCSKFKSLLWKLPALRLSVSIFGNGRVTFQGAKSVKDIKTAAKFLQVYFNSATVNKTQIVLNNFVASGKLNTHFPLQDFVLFVKKNHPEIDISYNGELYNGIIWKFSCGKQRALIYNTGSVIITGCRTESELAPLFECVNNVLSSFVASDILKCL